MRYNRSALLLLLYATYTPWTCVCAQLLTNVSNGPNGGDQHNTFQTANGPRTTLHQNHYNERGLTRHTFQDGTGLSGNRNFLQRIDYIYLADGSLHGINVPDGTTQGHLTGIQVGLPMNGGEVQVPLQPGHPGSATHNDKDLFYLELYRHQRPTTDDSFLAAPARYNGDISYVASQVRGRDQLLTGLHYDAYDRLAASRTYERADRDDQAKHHGIWDTDYTYDQRGNIETLRRNDYYRDGQHLFATTIDELNYTYKVSVRASTSC